MSNLERGSGRLFVGGVIFSLSLLLTGCGPGAAWYQRDVTIEQAAADCRECERRTHFESQDQYFDEMRDSRVTGVPTTPNELRQMNREQDFENCMRGKGYRLTKAEWLPKNIKRCHVSTVESRMTTVAGN